MVATGEDLTALSPLQLLIRFQAVQEERSRLYAQLSHGFKRYLAPLGEGSLSRNDLAYKGLMEQVTRGFADCSSKVRAVEAALNSPSVSRPDLAAVIRRVQECEREKLQVTVSYQALKTAMALRSDRQKMQEEEMKRIMERQAQISQAVSHLDSDNAALSAHAAHHASHAHACCDHHHQHDQCSLGDGPEEEATEAECQAAVQEAMLRLDTCVAGINDALDEIRYEVAALKEEEA